jgi:hypothetical protein
MLMAIERYPLLNKINGNISVHGREDLYIEIQFKNLDGTLRDVSSSVMVFELDGLVRAPLQPGASASEKVLRVSRDQLAHTSLHPRSFAFVDETSGAAQVFWSGLMHVFGLIGNPA